MTETEEKQYEKQYWDENYGGMEKYLGMPVHSEIVDFLALYYDVIGKRVVDLGGGPGLHCKILQERYLSQCINLDKSQYAISFFQHEVESYLCDLEKSAKLYYELGGRKFDFIYSLQVLEHCKEESIQSIAIGMLDHLVSGGHCFVSVSSCNNQKDKTHAILKSLDWWYEQFLSIGFEHDVVREKVASQAKLPLRLEWQCLYLRRP